MSTALAAPPAATPPATPARRPITVEEFERLPDADRYEVVDGELAERGEMSLESSMIGGNAYRRIAAYCDEHGGNAFPADAIFKVFGPRSRNMRRPDASYVAPGRIEDLSVGVGRVAPDLAVEVVSPNDLVDELDEKLSDYIQAGVRLIWVVHPRGRGVEVIEGERRSWAGEGDTLSGGEVLPGFELPVATLFAGVAGR